MCFPSRSRKLGRFGIRVAPPFGYIAFTVLLLISCTDSTSFPRYTLTFVFDDGRTIGRHADDIDVIAEVLQFDLISAPLALEEYPLIAVEGIANPPQSHVQFWYGPPKTLDDETFKLARFLLAQYGDVDTPIFSGGDPTNIAGRTTWWAESPNSILIRWVTSKGIFTLTAWGSSPDTVRKAVETIIQEDGLLDS